MTKLLQQSGGYFAELDVPLPSRGTSVVDFGAGGSATASTVVIGQSGITANAVVIAQVAIAASADHSADEHLVEGLRVMAGAVQAGVGFTLYARSENVNLFGRYNVWWLWS